MPQGLRPRLLFQDEAGFGRITDVRRCGAPAPWRPIAPRQQVREFVHALAVVSPFDGVLRGLLCRDLDSAVLSTLLAKLRTEFPGDFCLVVLDGAGAPIAHDLEVPAGFHLEWLPAHSPELNPVEPLWDSLRDHYTGHRAFPSLPRVETALCTAFQDLARQPDLVRSMTLFDWINPITLMPK
jgi:hypothetical protein